jgi:hypothetical protein
MKLTRLLLQAIASVGFAALAPVAHAQVLDIKPGQWKKTLRMDKDGKTIMNQSLDACMSAENLDFQVLKKKFAAPGPAACKLIEDEVTSTRVKVTIQCTGSTTRSTTQVKSREHVVVNATIDSGGGVTTSSEEWRFVKAADCAKEKLGQK